MKLQKKRRNGEKSGENGDHEENKMKLRKKGSKDEKSGETEDPEENKKGRKNKILPMVNNRPTEPRWIPLVWTERRNHAEEAGGADEMKLRKKGNNDGKSGKNDDPDENTKAIRRQSLPSQQPKTGRAISDSLKLISSLARFT